jgi:hypothetical protein
MLAVTNDQSMLQRNTTANVVPSSPILVTLMMEGQFLQKPHGIPSQMIA